MNYNRDFYRVVIYFGIQEPQLSMKFGDAWNESVRLAHEYFQRIKDREKNKILLYLN